MPIYEYECRQCGKRTELLQRFADAPLAACPECGGEVKKLFSAPAVQFKGTGWYVTDYGGKSSSKPESKSEGGKSESSAAKESSSSSSPSSPSPSSSPSSSGGESKGSSKPASSGSD
jgi:putative FmdB family regulatory protein